MKNNRTQQQSHTGGAAKAGAGAALLAILGGVAKQADDVGLGLFGSVDDVGRSLVSQTDDLMRLGAGTSDDLFRISPARPFAPIQSADDFAAWGDDAFSTSDDAMTARNAGSLGDDVASPSDEGGSHSVWSRVIHETAEQAIMESDALDDDQ